LILWWCDFFGLFLRTCQSRRWLGRGRRWLRFLLWLGTLLGLLHLGFGCRQSSLQSVALACCKLSILLRLLKLGLQHVTLIGQT